MKKILSLILVLVTILSLCACGGKTAGIPQTLPSPDLPEDKRPTDLSYLEGTWLDLSGKYTYTFDSDANCLRTHLSGQTQEGKAEYLYRSEETFIEICGASFTLEHIDGIPHLICGEYDLVPEQDYYGPRVIRITDDNWQEYFQVQELFLFSYNSSGILSIESGSAIVLKEEYARQMLGGKAAWQNHRVDFTVSYEEQYFQVLSADFENASITYGDRDAAIPSERKEKEYYLGYFNPETFPERNPLLGQVGLVFGAEPLERYKYEEGQRVAPRIVDFTVTQAQGYMLLEP